MHARKNVGNNGLKEHAGFVVEREQGGWILLPGMPQSSDTQPGPPYSCCKMVATRVFTEQNHCRALSFYLPLEFHIWLMLVELSSGLVYSMLLDVPHNCVRVIVEVLNSTVFLTQSFLLLHSHLHRKLWEYFTCNNSFILFLSCRWLKCLYSSRCVWFK